MPIETDDQIAARKAREKEVELAWRTFRPSVAARSKAWRHRSNMRTMPIGEIIQEGDIHRTTGRKFTMAPPDHIGQPVRRANYYRTLRPL